MWNNDKTGVWLDNHDVDQLMQQHLNKPIESGTHGNVALCKEASSVNSISCLYEHWSFVLCPSEELVHDKVQQLERLHNKLLITSEKMKTNQGIMVCLVSSEKVVYACTN